MLQMWKVHRNMWDGVWGKIVDMSQYFHAVYHASKSHTFVTPLTHNFPMSCYRFVTYSPWHESSKVRQQWGKSMGKMWKTTPNVVVITFSRSWSGRAFLWVFIQLTDSVRKSSWHGSFVPKQDHHKCWLKQSIYNWWELDFIGLKIQMHRMFQSRSCVTKLESCSDHS